MTMGIMAARSCWRRTMGSTCFSSRRRILRCRRRSAILSTSGRRTATSIICRPGRRKIWTRQFDGTNFLFHDQLVHTTYDDYWKKRDLSLHMKNIHAAVMTVGGWFDAEDLSGPFKTFHAIDEFNPGRSEYAGGGAVDAWRMVADGRRSPGGCEVRLEDGAVLSGEDRVSVFRALSEGRGNGVGPLPKAYVFETGSNVWKKYDAWPPKSAAAKTLYFRAGGRLSFDAPTEKSGVDEYVSDPAHPVPFVNYTTDTVPQRYMDDDQRFASRRPDVLTYETEPLTEDVTIAGPVRPKLKVASSGTDSDFVVKLIDVYPEDYPDPPAMRSGRESGAAPILMGGYEQLVRGEPMRAKFRDSWEKPTAADAGEDGFGECRDAGYEPHVPCGAPDHGAGAELVVSAGGSESADVCGYTVCEAGAVCEGDGERVSECRMRRVELRCWWCLSVETVERHSGSPAISEGREAEVDYAQVKARYQMRTRSLGRGRVCRLA